MRTVYKQERWGLFALLITNAGMAALMIFYISRGESQMIILSSLFLVYSAVLLINFLKTRIITDDSSITYQTLFHNKSMRFDSIRKIESTANLTGGGPNGGVRGKYRTTLYSDSDKISIGIKTFSKKDLTEFATTLVTRCTKATIDDSTKFMMEGKMPSAFMKYKK